MNWTRSVPAAVAVIASWWAAVLPGQGPEVNRYAQREEATLEEQLNSGLKVRTATERAFIARVAKTVQAGQLSESLVKALFHRARAHHSRYPLPYFTAMIRQVAKTRGVEL
jgi:hypothetical protein